VLSTAMPLGCIEVGSDSDLLMLRPHIDQLCQVFPQTSLIYELIVTNVMCNVMQCVM